MYLLDTNTLIYFFKGMGSVSKNVFLQSPNEIFVPTVVLYELQVGIEKSNNARNRIKQLQALLQKVTVLSFGENEAKIAAKIRVNLEFSGTPIGPIDVLIAGCAKANNLTLVTRNLKEFERIPELKLENWY